jgi:peptidoglycan/xylan/chitin deacetylase (PgdA/CDA1 family)
MSNLREKLHAAVNLRQVSGAIPYPLALLRFLRIYLRYDESIVLAQIADFLRRNGIRLTVFVTGASLARRCAEARAFADLGCEIGLHGFRHYSPNRVSQRCFEDDLARCLAAFNAHSLNPRGYRAPNLAMRADAYPILRRRGVAYSSSVMLPRKGLEPMELGVHFQDFPIILERHSPEEARRAIREHIMSGHILCLHPYGLFHPRFHGMLAGLVREMATEPITLAEKATGGQGPCMTLDLGT